MAIGNRGETSGGSGPLFLFYGNGSLLNRGCEAILRSTVAIFQKEFSPCRFVNASRAEHTPDEETPDLPVRHIFSRSIRRWTLRWAVRQVRKCVPVGILEAFEQALPECSAALALGGDNYSLDYGRPKWFFRANDIILRKGKPTILWGASVGPFDKDAEFELWAAKALKHVTLICARESETVAYLASLGVTKNVRLVADPAFILEPTAVDLDADGLGVLREPCFGLNLSPLLGRYWRREKPWIDAAADCLRAVLKVVEMPVVLVPHVFTPSSDDAAFLKSVAARVPEARERCVVIAKQYSAPQLKWIISQLVGFAGARTHATIAALSSGVPTVSIGYSMKSRGINKDVFGHDDWVLPLERLEPAGLAEAVRRVIEAGASVSAHLKKTMPAYQEKTWQAAGLVRKVLQESP